MSKVKIVPENNRRPQQITRAEEPKERPLEEVARDFAELMAELYDHSECPLNVAEQINDIFLNTINEDHHTSTTFRMCFPGYLMAAREYEKKSEKDE